MIECVAMVYNLALRLSSSSVHNLHERTMFLMCIKLHAHVHCAQRREKAYRSEAKIGYDTSTPQCS